MLCCLPLLAWAQNIFTAKTVEGVDMTFKVISEIEKTCMVGDETYVSPSIPSNYRGGISIPSTVNGFKVTRIGSCAFNECGGLTSVSIPETVSSIGANAFRRTRITEIEFPNSLESIENGAFQEQLQYEESKKVFWDNYSTVKTAADNRAKKIALRMKARGVSIEDIAEMTDLGIEEIEAL